LALRKLSTAYDSAISVINNYAAGSHTLYIITSSVLQKLGHLACSTSLIASIWDGVPLSTKFTPPTVWDATNTYLLADLLINYSGHQGFSHVAPRLFRQQLLPGHCLEFSLQAGLESTQKNA
jgi:hypothetical protein